MATDMGFDVNKNDFYRFPIDSEETRSVRLLYDRLVNV